MALLAAAIPAAALAQTVNPNGTDTTTGGTSIGSSAIPETVVTATRIPTPVQEIPAGVTVITRQTIENRGYNTLVDALSAVPGLHIVQSGGPGANASVFIRGTDSNQVLVLENGVPINDPSDPGGAFNFGSDTLAGVQRIEVIRGPMSSLYGSGAIGGVINIITTPGSGPPHGTISIAAGLPDANQVDAGLSGSSGPFDYRLNASALTMEGFDVTPRRESVYTGERDGFQNQQGNLDLGLTVVPGTRLSFYASGRHSLGGFDTLGFPAFDAPNEVAYDTSALGTLALSSQVLPWFRTVLMASGLYDFRHYVDPLNPADPNQESNNDHYQGTRVDLQWNDTVDLPDQGPARDQTLTFGFEHINDFVNVSLNDSFFGVPFVQETHAEQISSAWHAGVQSTFWRRLTFTGGVREDAVSAVGNAFTWRGGFVLALPELSSRFHISGGTAFLAPSLFDLYGSGGGFQGNPNLKPERSIGFEVGWSTTLPGFGRADFATLGVTYFHTDVRDLIETVFLPVFTTVNIGLAHLQGVETTLALRLRRWLSADLAYTYTDARDADTGALLLRRPENQFSANLLIRPLPKLTIAPELLHIGPFEDALVDNNGFPAGTGLASSGTIVNVNTTYQLTPHLALFLTGNNIFDSKFEPASGFAYPGASFLLGARASF
ncbi:MAG: TonB-dependent receptor [Rhodospirillales bacterium]|nr:TonB-dependent receptor [Rhodospirillales bacterium]